MNSVKQYVYYDLLEESEYDSKLSNDSNFIVANKSDSNYFELVNNKAIKQIGIQSLPGSKFYFNSIAYPIIIGNTGYFEIGLDANIMIGTVYIDSGTKDLIKNNPAAMIIIDTIEEKGGN